MGRGVKAFLDVKPCDPDVKKVLEIMDKLLEGLPTEKIDEFTKSPEYKIYQKVLERYEIK